MLKNAAHNPFAEKNLIFEQGSKPKKKLQNGTDDETAASGVEDLIGQMPVPGEYPHIAQAGVSGSGKMVQIGQVLSLEEAAKEEMMMASAAAGGSVGGSSFGWLGWAAAIGGGAAGAAAMAGGGSDSPASAPPPAPADTALQITSASSATFAENGTGIVYTVLAASDKTLTYGISGDDAPLFHIDPASGGISFIASPDYENPLDSNGDNRYDLSVTVSDGTLSSSVNIQIEVLDCLEVYDPLDTFDASLWNIDDGWGNGDPFLNDWSASQVVFQGGLMELTLDSVNGNLVSGSVRSDDFLGYGYYEVTMKASGTAGTINGFFTYTGPSEGDPHDEIDIEIKGDDPTKMQVNYWTDDIEHPVMIDLGFDASADFHTYAFSWREGGIEWYVDDILVHTEEGANGILPDTPGQLFVNLWGSIGITSWSTDYDVANNPAQLSVDEINYTLYSSVVG